MNTYPNAKINIGLNVVEKREDGYHNIETIFYPIGLSDELEILEKKNTNHYLFSQSGINFEGSTEDNIVIKAYRLISSHFSIPPLEFTLNKKIPIGAGLGGGSSDGASTLMAINQLFKLNISTNRLERFAIKLGADCPFFIQNKPVFATELGNKFTPLNLSLKGYKIVLVKPNIHIATPLAYSLIRPQKPQNSLQNLIELPIKEWKNFIINDFESPIFHLFPQISDIKQKLYSTGAIYASMSGSGSTVYGIFEKEQTIENKFHKCFLFEELID